MPRVGGIIFVDRNGQKLRAKGSWEWDLGLPEREPVVGAAEVHGYKETHRAATLKGVITDAFDVSVEETLRGTNETISLELANGKLIVFRNATSTGSSQATTEEGEVPVEWFAESAEEVT